MLNTSYVKLSVDIVTQLCSDALVNLNRIRKSYMEDELVKYQEKINASGFLAKILRSINFKKTGYVDRIETEVFMKNCGSYDKVLGLPETIYFKTSKFAEQLISATELSIDKCLNISTADIQVLIFLANAKKIGDVVGFLT